MQSKKEHQELLKKYAEAVVRVGLNLRAGQRLIITNATARARYVEVIWGDEEMLRIRLQNAPDNSFDEYPTWQINALTSMIENGDALLSVSANDPDIYMGLDSDRVSAMQKAHLENYGPVSAKVTRNAM